MILKKKLRINTIFGSNSDEKKILPGIKAFTEDIKNLEVKISYASADNTPEKVEKIMKKLSSKRGNKVYISSAGMSNVLTGVVKGYASLNDLVIGVPITDSRTGGVSSVLSTSEKPDLNPVLFTGLNNTYSALNIGYRFLKITKERKYINEIVVVDGSSNSSNSEAIDKINSAIDDYSLSCDVKYINNSKRINKDSIVINVFRNINDYQNDIKKEHWMEIDEKLSKGNGIQIGIIPQEPVNYTTYIHCLDDTQATGMVGIKAYKNAVQIAAQIIKNKSAIEKLSELKEKKAEDLNKNKGLVVSDGKAKYL